MLNRTLVIAGWVMISLTMIQAGSCKSKDLAKSKTSATKVDEDGRRIVNLYVSFYSIAYGIDYEAQTGLKNYMASFEEQHKVKLNVTEVRWGREGEIDYCFDLENLKADQQAEFIAGTKKILSVSKLVHIIENTGCKHESGQ